ncbi:unnamed protein product [Soboliphyme baturini]|uniref:ZP domain-containing protein n=1 Tax=Soboliphyme baturini TaxID=241478 RepID=A0A183IYY1_9BILA|nr:unnamed protein product [Soboliphyme baturini]
MMNKTKINDDIIYYLPMTAFRFPQSDDVYFSCSVEICESCRFPGPCNLRIRRSVSTNGDRDADWSSVLSQSRFQSVVLYDSMRITEDESSFHENEEPEPSLHEANDGVMGCMSSTPEFPSDVHPNLFTVATCDNSGRGADGYLEVTLDEIIFHQRRHDAMRWPLQYVKRYGYDNNIFR